MLSLKQGSESALRILYLTGHCSIVSPHILKKFVRPRFLCGTWDIQCLYWHSEYCASDDCYL